MKITKEQIKAAEQVLIDNGIDADEAETVLQAIGYTLLDEELYPEEEPETLIDPKDAADPVFMAKREALLMEVKSYGVSIRVLNILKIRDIKTFADLVQYSRPEIIRWRNLGRKSFSEITEMVEKMGLSFNMDPLLYGIRPVKKYY